MSAESLSNILGGIAGEYFVAAELSRRGHIATITLRSTRGIDILASNLDASKSVGIQVKTSRGKDASWIVGRVAEQLVEDDLYYVFVNLNNGGEPTYRVVTSAVVAEKVRKSHRDNLSRLRRDGKPRKDSSMRIFTDRSGRYVGDWDLLDL